MLYGPATQNAESGVRRLNWHQRPVWAGARIPLQENLQVLKLINVKQMLDLFNPRF